jgi:hypothetical protein
MEYVHGIIGVTFCVHRREEGDLMLGGWGTPVYEMPPTM